MTWHQLGQLTRTDLLALILRRWGDGHGDLELATLSKEHLMIKAREAGA